MGIRSVTTISCDVRGCTSESKTDSGTWQFPPEGWYTIRPSTKSPEEKELILCPKHAKRALEPEK